jgi:uncharacterized membrane protein
MSMRKPGRALKRHFVAGLIVIAPVGITAAVLWWLFQRVDGLIGRFVYPMLPVHIPGLGLLALVLLLIGVGWLAELAIGTKILSWWQKLLERIPLARRIYGAANRITRTVFGRDGRPFKSVVLVEYPSPGRWTVGFLSAASPDAVQHELPDSVTVFIPTAPNPTSGFLVVVPREHARHLSMSVDDAFTFVLSAGAVRPELLHESDGASHGPAVGAVDRGNT